MSNVTARENLGIFVKDKLFGSNFGISSQPKIYFLSHLRKYKKKSE